MWNQWVVAVLSIKQFGTDRWSGLLESPDRAHLDLVHNQEMKESSSQLGPLSIETPVSLAPLPTSMWRMVIQRIQVKCACDLAGGRPQNRNLMAERATLRAWELL